MDCNLNPKHRDRKVLYDGRSSSHLPFSVLSSRRKKPAYVLRIRTYLLEEASAKKKHKANYSTLRHFVQSSSYIHNSNFCNLMNRGPSIIVGEAVSSLRVLARHQDVDETPAERPPFVRQGNLDHQPCGERPHPDGGQVVTPTLGRVVDPRDRLDEIIDALVDERPQGIVDGPGPAEPEIPLHVAKVDHGVVGTDFPEKVHPRRDVQQGQVFCFWQEILVVHENGLCFTLVPRHDRRVQVQCSVIVNGLLGEESVRSAQSRDASTQVFGTISEFELLLGWLLLRIS